MIVKLSDFRSRMDLARQYLSHAKSKSVDLSASLKELENWEPVSFGRARVDSVAWDTMNGIMYRDLPPNFPLRDKFRKRALWERYASAAVTIVVVCAIFFGSPKIFAVVAIAYIFLPSAFHALRMKKYLKASS